MRLMYKQVILFIAINIKSALALMTSMFVEPDFLEYKTAHRNKKFTWVWSISLQSYLGVNLSAEFKKIDNQ